MCLFIHPVYHPHSSLLNEAQPTRTVSRVRKVIKPTLQKWAHHMVHLMGKLNEPSPWPNATQVDSLVTLHTRVDGRTCAQTYWCWKSDRLLQTAGPQNTFPAIEFNYPLQLLNFPRSVSMLLFPSAFLPLFFFHAQPFLPLSHHYHPVLSACLSSTPSHLSTSLRRLTPPLTLYGLWCCIDSVKQLITVTRA